VTIVIAHPSVKVGPVHPGHERGDDVQKLAEHGAARGPCLGEGVGAPRSVAVLPFVNMSEDPQNEYFSDGITEEVLDRLAKIPELRVAARTSSFSFKARDVPVPEIARQLGDEMQALIKKWDEHGRAAQETGDTEGREDVAVHLYGFPFRS
jgi:hypothetical protein